MKDGFIVGPQLKQLIEDHDFSPNQMLQTEELNWHLKSSAETIWTVKKTKITVKLWSNKFILQC